MGDEVVIVTTAGETDTGCEFTLIFAQQSLRGDFEELNVALPVSPMRQCQYTLIIMWRRSWVTFQNQSWRAAVASSGSCLLHGVL